MTLGYMQKFPWKVDGQPEPTNFREKILQGVGSVWINGSSWSKPNGTGGGEKIVKMYWDEIAKYNPKFHTIREDKHNRWKAGRKIEMVYRGPKYSILSHFNKGIPELEKCVSVQKIEIKWVELDGAVVLPPVKELRVFIDGRRLIGPELNTLAVNDGFKDIHHFGNWFKKDFTGKIIHWTDLRY